MKREKEALDLDGSKILDSKGQGMVKVCEDEDQDDIHVKQEMEELQNLAIIASHADQPNRPRSKKSPNSEHNKPTHNRIGLKPENSGTVSIKQEPQHPSPSLIPLPQHSNPLLKPPQAEVTTTQTTDSACPICSMINEPSALLCAACSHVLQPRLMPGHWRCQSTDCRGSQYLNPRDSGICGVCGERRSSG